MVDGAQRSRRVAALVVLLSATLSFVGCGGLGLLPQRADQPRDRTFRTYGEVEAAYAGIVPGRTGAAELARLGFDAAVQPHAEALSYLGVIERFMPRDSTRFDRLAAPVRDCIAAQERCSAYVFRPSRFKRRRAGSLMLDLLGFERTTIDRGWAAEIVLLMQDGRVAYKAMSGQPHIEGYHDDIEPLGPPRDLIRHGQA